MGLLPIVLAKQEWEITSSQRRNGRKAYGRLSPTLTRAD